MRKPSNRRGGTLTELMVATVILSIGVLGLFGAFKFIARSTLISRATSLATNLGQERIESLKNLSYYALQITTATATDATVSPSILYDTVNYPKETIAIGGITFTRYTYVGMAELSGSDITNVAFTYPDTGLKQITVYIVWTESGQKKVWSLRNLLENPNINPLDATITGTVSNSGGGTVASALVVVEQNEDWGATANATGVYSFAVYHGTYTVRASSHGFNDAVSGSIAANRGTTVNVPLTLSSIATGYIQGEVWYNPDLVISQVVASTLTMSGGSQHNVEYIELYNPTTWPINIGTTGSYPKAVALRYRDENAAFDKDDSPAGFDFVHVTTYVAPGHYYLYANATAFYILGTQVTADAYYNSVVSYPNNIRDDKAGTIQIYRPSSGLNIDQVGWDDNPIGGCLYFEGSVIPDALGANDGLGTPAGKQIVRVSSPGISAAMLPSYGRAYDSDNNARDWLYEGAGFTGFVYAPNNSASGAFTTLTGKVATGTFVSAGDPNSGSTIAYVTYITSGALSLPYARFVLPGVSTGVWSVSMAYGASAAFIDTVTVVQNAYTPIPNAGTTPAWAGSLLYHTQLASSTVSGFVKGVITNAAGAAIGGITVQGGGSSKVTGSNGVYFMAVSSGTVAIIANPNNLNPSYVQGIDTPLITAGAVTTQNFTLALGGRITGYVTTGTTPLAFQPVAATGSGGSQSGSGVTDTGGNFTIRNVSTGTYTVFPVLETGQDVSPNTLSATLTSAGSVFAGTFTVAGAFGSITGTVTDASGLVTSGALLIASTNSIASTPAAIVGSSAPAQVPVYMVSSKADGTFDLPVRGGATYYLSAYVPVISGTTVSVTTKTYSGIIVSPSAATAKNVTIP
jgi:hypothetical protein